MINGLLSRLRRRKDSESTPTADPPVSPPKKRYRYTVISCIMGGYEPVREVANAPSDVRYILVTDGKGVKSRTWEVRNCDEFPALSKYRSPISKVNYVRYHPFEFADTEISIYIDGSMRINKSLDKLYDDFSSSSSDIGIGIHPYRANVYEEISTWISFRGLPREESDSQKRLFGKTYFNRAVLFQSALILRKNSTVVNVIDDITWAMLILTGHGGESARLDQTVLTYVISTYFSGTRFFLFSQHVMQSSYITMYTHGTSTPVVVDSRRYIRPSVYGKIIHPYMIE